MALKQAIQIKNLQKAIKEDVPIVLLTPKGTNATISDIFQQRADITAEKAKMTRLDQWAKPPRKNGKLYGHIETEDWTDFERKLKYIFSAGNLTKLFIEYDGYITNFQNTQLHKESEKTLLQALEREEGGVALYTDSELKISFIKLQFNKNKDLSVTAPYLNKSNDTVQHVYLHTPHMKMREEYHDQYDHINLT